MRPLRSLPGRLRCYKSHRRQQQISHDDDDDRNPDGCQRKQSFLLLLDEVKPAIGCWQFISTRTTASVPRHRQLAVKCPDKLFYCYRRLKLAANKEFSSRGKIVIDPKPKINRTPDQQQFARQKRCALRISLAQLNGPLKVARAKFKLMLERRRAASVRFSHASPSDLSTDRPIILLRPKDLQQQHPLRNYHRCRSLDYTR